MQEIAGNHLAQRTLSAAREQWQAEGLPLLPGDIGQLYQSSSPLGWTAPRHLVPKFGCRDTNWRPSMSDIRRIAIDTSKSVFTLHGVDDAGRVVLRRNLRRRELLPFFATQPSLEVALEAC